MLADGSADLDPDLHLHIADLDDVIDLERLLLTGIDAVAIEIGAVGTVEILQPQLTVFEADEGMLP